MEARKEPMASNESRRPLKATWAYGYEISPAQAEERLHAVQRLLDRENAAARREARTWSGRVVLEQQVTHILVVSDDPERDHDVNGRLEAALTALNVRYARTAPLALEDDAAQTPMTAAGGVDH